MREKLHSLIDYFRKQPTPGKIVLGISACFVLSVFFLTVLILLAWVGVFGPLPGREELRNAENPTAAEIYSADSVLLGRYFVQERSTISKDQLPKHVVDALIATEDVRFYQHNGIDNRSILRVFLKRILIQRDASGGASTITQQLAKNLYPRRGDGFLSVLTAKIREMIIARRLESVFDKETLITLYLNTVPFGENTFGIEAAAQLFFSVPARKLSIEQAATLVGMLKANHLYNPRIYPEQSRGRRNVVLSQMAKYEMLSDTTADSLKALPLVLQYNKITYHIGPAPYFREYLRPELQAWCEKYNSTHEEQINLYTSGLKIYTTIDSRLQRYAEEAMEAQMARIQESYRLSWGKSEPWDSYPGMVDEVVRRSDHFQRLKKQGLSDAEIFLEMETPVPMTVFTWAGDQEPIMSPVDSIKYYLKFLHAGVLAVDPSNGAVRVWVGGIQHRYFQFDHVRESTRRQVGSVFKPVVYASALEQGMRPCAFISAEKIQYTNMKDWSPVNSEENYKLKYSMPGALAHSVNTVSVQLLEKAGIDNTIKLARRMGIKSELEPVPSLALGSANISVMEMVRAYTTFANSGSVVKPFWVTSIVSREDALLEEFSPDEPTTAMSSGNAQMILHMLRRAVNEGGTSAGLRSRFELPNDIGAKTGTTQSSTDGWLVAVTPKLVMGAWVGADDPRMRPRTGFLGQGARTALPIVGDFFQRANKDKTLNDITRARFPELDPVLASKLDCAFAKEENNFLKRVFARGEKEKKREFGDKSKKRGFFKRLFGKKEKSDSL